jgi:hypothetical protein
MPVVKDAMSRRSDVGQRLPMQASVVPSATCRDRR